MPSLNKVRRPRTATQKIHDRLARAIARNYLKPGAQLVAESLAHQLGVSRTPVREALMLLEREGLVESLSGRGVFVKGLELSDLLHIFEFREAIEMQALRLAASSDGDLPSTLVRMRDELLTLRDPRSSEEVEVAADTDLKFHRALVAAAGNPRMTDAWDQLATQLRRFWVDGRTAPGRAKTDIEECLAVLACVEAGDTNGAVRALQAHLAATRRALVAWREESYQP